MSEYTKLINTKNRNIKRLGKTMYKYVYLISYNGVETYSVEMPMYKYYKPFENLREAAIAVDKKLIENNREPINILKTVKHWILFGLFKFISYICTIKIKKQYYG